MEHILDNPIWNGLLTGNKSIAHGSEKAKYFAKEIAAFAGMKDNNEDDFNCLYNFTPFNSPIVLFAAKELIIPKDWKVLVKKDLLQMVYQQRNVPTVDDHSFVPLQEKDIPAMIELTTKTNPGPFLSRTIDFGNYEGVFDKGILVAMAGQRFQPDPYVEISAVCTHPDYSGKGHASNLIRSQISKILMSSKIPFLHVLPDNTSASNLYQKLGFEIRKKMMVYVIEKNYKFI
ncbi:GNAT family N-acetyltransferase [Rubrolithibacter danxiaensis]|uniref:GNAT family N-acetyltransferase n=1 Tax=Rubrolithibacter danxiaensis TaxID=3390805 RepID=UPI003BF89D81